MADNPLTIDAFVNSNYEGMHAGPIYTDRDTAYAFFLDNTDFALWYVKTTDAGRTWGTPVSVAAFAPWFSVWFDKHTPGDSGTVIHIGYVDFDNTGVAYRSLDTATDTLGAAIAVQAGLATSFGDFTNGYIDICKAVGGNLYIQAWANTSNENWFLRSTDDGATWANTFRSAADGNASDQIILLPDADSSDTQDMAMIYWDVSANELTLKKWDNSVPSWTETALASGFTESATMSQFDAMVRHSDGHLLLAAHEQFDNAASDLKCFDIDLAGPTVVAKADVTTATADVILVALHIDQNTDRVRVAYAGQNDGGQTVGTALDVHSVLSIDGMGSWGLETTYSEDVADDITGLWAGRSTPGAKAGRFGPMFHNQDTTTLFVNVTNSIAMGPTLSLEDDIRTHLIAQLTDEPDIFVQGLPALPDDAIGIVMSGGPPPVLAMGPAVIERVFFFSVYVRTGLGQGEAAETLMQAVHAVLRATKDVTINSTTYDQIVSSSIPRREDDDLNGRPVQSATYTIWRAGV